MRTLLGSLWQARMRTTISAAGISISVMMITLSLGFFSWLHHEAGREADRFSDKVILQLPGSPFPPVGARWIETLSVEAMRIPLVDPADSTPVLLQPLNLDSEGGDPLPIVFVGLEPGRESTYTGLELGVQLKPGLRQAVLGSKIARELEASPGDQLSLAEAYWDVVAVLPLTGADSLDWATIVPLDQAQEAFSAPDLISFVILSPREHVTPRALEVRLSGSFPSLESVGYEALQRRIRDEFSLTAGLLGAMGVLAFMTGAVMLSGSLMVSVVSRAVSLLKEDSRAPLPTGRAETLGLTMGLSLAMALLGGLPGMLAGVLLAHLVGWPFLFSALEASLGLGVICLLALAGGIYPSVQAGGILWRAARFGRLEKDMQEAFESREDILRVFRQQLRAREMERQQVARDLHDGILQSLLGLKMTLRGVTSDRTLTDSLDQAIKDLRRLCADLRPPALDHLGLGAALRSMASEHGSHHDLPVIFWEQGEDPGIPGDVAIALYRVAQEALSNAIRHAQASQVEITLRHLPSRTILQVQDDGKGFTPPARPTALSRRGHFGLAGMHERISLAGGRLTVNSQPGRGTRIRAEVPLPAGTPSRAQD